jgi:macrolide phosphotransferase
MKPPPEDTLVKETKQLAARNGLELTGDLTFNEMGLDYRIAFAQDRQGLKWVLRIPRRDDLRAKIEHEARVLRFVKHQLRIQVPDWQVCTPHLIAYPLLDAPIALTYDAQTHVVTWHADPHCDDYIESLAQVLVDLHASPVPEAVSAKLLFSTPEQARAKILTDLARVKSEVGVSDEFERQLKTWVDNETLWPKFSSLIHGDLYAGHLTVDSSSRISGIIDWSEAEVTDPSIDFVGHLAALSPESLETLVSAYARRGGRVWPGMIRQIKARLVASPLRYALYAIQTGNPGHLAAAKSQLGGQT